MITNISIYKSVKHTETTETIALDIFLDNVRDGKWQDQVLSIRTIQDKEIKRAEKAKLPNVTISGIFGKRVDSDCKLHSGFIAIDIDDLGAEVEGTRTLLNSDPYIYASFTSVSGTGICCLVRIDSDKHREAFEGIADYLIRKYQIIVDPTGVNKSRARFVSFDPQLFTNPKSLLFKKYLPKPKKKKILHTIFVQTEFDDVIRQMVEQNVSCVEDYRDWRDIGFGLADQFGEAGRSYFHALSGVSSKYETSMCDRQYSHCLRSTGSRNGSKITIATIYWFASQSGIKVFSDKTRKVAAATSTLKKAGLDAAGIAENIKRFEGIEGVEEIIKQAYAANQNFSAGETLIDNIRMWLRHGFEIKRNVITRKLEDRGRILDEIDLNTMYLDCKVIFDDVNFELFCKILFSANTPQYNPILDFFTANADIPCDGAIDAFFGCFDSPDDIKYFGKKWLVGAISAIHGTHSPLMLILAGEIQGTGKTEAFRRMLPAELQQYYAESKLDAGKDDEILMTQKWFIMDDEMGGKSKKESKRLKELTSKQTFTLREPYGKMNVDLRRIAVLCGTTNDMEILNDPTGNRRLLPMEVRGINLASYNTINKTALIMEAYKLWKNDFNWQLTREDIARLGGKTEKFDENTIEYDLIQKYFTIGDSSYMTATDIKVYIEVRSNQKLSLKRLGMDLKKLGYVQTVIKVGSRPSRVYAVNMKDSGLPIPASGFKADLSEPF